MRHFSNAALAQIEAQAARLKYEAHKEFYDKVAAITAKLKARADAAKAEAEAAARSEYLDREIARMRKELGPKYVRVASNSSKRRNRIHKVKMRLKPYYVNPINGQLMLLDEKTALVWKGKVIYK